MRGLDPARDLPAFPGPSEQVEAGGVSWRVVRRGATGPLLLLLHGAGASAHSWAAVIDDLAEDHRIIAPDLPGHGFSSRGPGGRQSLPVMAEAMRALLQELDAAPDLVAGHSAGAAIALRVVLNGDAAPRLVYAVNGALTPFRGLAGVLFPPMARALAANPFTPRVAAAALAADPGAARRLILGTGSAADPVSLELYRRLFATPAHVDGALRMMAQWDLDPLLRDLPSLRVPLMLAVGGKDRAVPPGEAAALARRLPLVTLEKHPELGHLMHEEAPTLFAARLRALAATPSGFAGAGHDPDGGAAAA